MLAIKELLFVHVIVVGCTYVHRGRRLSVQRPVPWLAIHSPYAGWHGGKSPNNDLFLRVYAYK